MSTEPALVRPAQLLGRRPGRDSLREYVQRKESNELIAVHVNEATHISPILTGGFIDLEREIAQQVEDLNCRG